MNKCSEYYCYLWLIKYILFMATSYSEKELRICINMSLCRVCALCYVSIFVCKCSYRVSVFLWWNFNDCVFTYIVCAAMQCAQPHSVCSAVCAATQSVRTHVLNAQELSSNSLWAKAAIHEKFSWNPRAINLLRFKVPLPVLILSLCRWDSSGKWWNWLRKYTR